MKGKFLYFTRSSKTTIPEDSGDKLHMNITIPRATNKKSIPKDILKNTINQDEIPKLYPDKPQGGKKQ